MAAFQSLNFSSTFLSRRYADLVALLVPRGKAKTPPAWLDDFEELWNRKTPAGLKAYIASNAAAGFPQLGNIETNILEWDYGPPACKPNVNVFVQAVQRGQGLMGGGPLIALFTGTVPVGHDGCGNNYFAAVYPTERRHPVVFWDHDESRMTTTAATLDAFAYGHLLARLAREEGAHHQLVGESLADVRGLLAVSPAPSVSVWKTPLDSVEATRYRRCKWLITLLGDDETYSEEEILRRLFDRTLNTMSSQDWNLGIQKASRHVHTALYMLFRAYLTDDKKRLTDLLKRCHRSKSRLIRDAASCIESLAQGAGRLGQIKNMQQRKERLLSLGLAARCRIKP